MIAVIGDVLVDIVAKTTHAIAVASDTPANVRMSPGGSASGTAAWLAHDGVPVCLLAAVGTDALAKVALASLNGVDLRLHRTPDQPTGSCVIIVNASGERSMFPDIGANTSWAWRPHDLDGVSHVHVSAYPAYRDETHEAVISAMIDAQARGISVSLDLASSAPILLNKARAMRAIECSDLVFANHDEAAALLGASDDDRLLDELLEYVSAAVIKRGPLGCIAGTGDQRLSAAALPADVVDSTGAGDAFSAGFLPAWLSGTALATCMDLGQRSAIRTLGRVGAGPVVGENPQ